MLLFHVQILKHKACMGGGQFAMLAKCWNLLCDEWWLLLFKCCIKSSQSALPVTGKIDAFDTFPLLVFFFHLNISSRVNSTAPLCLYHVCYSCVLLHLSLSYHCPGCTTVCVTWPILPVLTFLQVASENFFAGGQWKVDDGRACQDYLGEVEGEVCLWPLFSGVRTPRMCIHTCGAKYWD